MARVVCARALRRTCSHRQLVVTFVHIMVCTSARNNPQLIEETAEIAAFLDVLERPVGWHTTRCEVCLGAFAGTIFSAARYSQTATKVAYVAFVCMCIVVKLTVCKCGASLPRTINKSMLPNSSTPSMASTRTAAAGGHEKEGRRGRLDELVAARKNISMATSFCLTLGRVTIAILLFSVFNPFSMFAPLVFFATPMVHVWHRLR